MGQPHGLCGLRARDELEEEERGCSSFSWLPGGWLSCRGRDGVCGWRRLARGTVVGGDATRGGAPASPTRRDAAEAWTSSSVEATGETRRRLGQSEARAWGACRADLPRTRCSCPLSLAQICSLLRVLRFAAASLRMRGVDCFQRILRLLIPVGW